MLIIEIIYSSKNFVVLKYKEKYYCFSYCKLIALSINNIIKVDNAKIETQKNKCHLKQFKEIVGELKENNTL